MAAALEKILREALELSDECRLHLAEQLIASVCDNPDSEIEAQQRAEVQRRIAEVQSGRVQLIPGEVVLREVRDAVRGKERP